MAKHSSFILGPGGVVIGGGAGFIKPSGGGAVAGALENVPYITDIAPFPQTYAYPTSQNATDYGVGIRWRMSPREAIQIWQDTEINEIRYYVVTASNTDEWYFPLYKYDYPNNKFVKITQWTVNAPGLAATGGISVTLPGGPITITPGTYFIWYGSKNNSAPFGQPYTFLTSSSARSKTEWGTGVGLPNSNGAQINYMQLTTKLPSDTEGPAEIPNDPATLFRGFAGDNKQPPYLII